MNMLVNEKAPAIYFLLAAIFELYVPLLLAEIGKYFLF